ncbi:glycerate kinase [Pragia fontium]|uniref:glycerate kinase n=1 Tax=Pragia fontium TaxID=82985 RepID=UPI000F71B0C8|nr:glycerate kinase [Pragia fontium]VEJ53167.1 Glycerate kinase [Pragia fontium]
MKIVIAIDSFKGSCSAQQACQAIASGLTRYRHDITTYQLPIADGGEGLLQILNESPSLKGLIKHSLTVSGPYGQQVDAEYLMLDGGTAIIEMAQACGLELTPKEKRHSAKASSYGLGQLVKQALDQGCQHIIIGLGGSATNDGGIGFAQALGVQFFDRQHNLIPAPACGEDLIRVNAVDISQLHPAISNTLFEASCDVNNPLLGDNGATRIYGPQKGATAAQLDQLEAGMVNYHQVLSQILNHSVNQIPGSGAAGGMGAVLLWFTQAQLRPGIELVLELLDAEKLIKDADLIITGEGKLDKQSSFGKAPVGVATLAATYNKPVIALAGSLGEGANLLYQNNIDAMWSICPRPISLEQAMQDVEVLLADTAEALIRTLNVGMRLIPHKCR